MIHDLFTRAALAPAAHPWPFLVLAGLGLYAAGCCVIEACHRRRQDRLYRIHRASFRPGREIVCHDRPAEAGASRTPDAHPHTARPSQDDAIVALSLATAALCMANC